jgi:bifunctional DNA-binding transcriptional regulator/antitoxin component of YhaV-PrlF toxin-antitoxin module
MTIIIAASEGTVALPDDMRDALGVKPGAEVIVEYRDGSVVIRPRPETAHEIQRRDPEEFRRRLESVRGAFNFEGMTTDEYLDLTRDRKA